VYQSEENQKETQRQHISA
jgi:hypothetical protein